MRFGDGSDPDPVLTKKMLTKLLKILQIWSKLLKIAQNHKKHNIVSKFLLWAPFWILAADVIRLGVNTKLNLRLHNRSRREHSDWARGRLLGAGFRFLVVATKCKAVRALHHNTSKGSKRVSWNAAYIAVKLTRVCGLRVFSFGMVAASQDT